MDQEARTLTFSERLQEIRTGFERPFWIANLTRDLRAPLLLRRLRFAGALPAGAPEFLDRADRNADRNFRRHGLVSRHLWRSSCRSHRLPPRVCRRPTSFSPLAYFLIGSIGAPWLAPVRNVVPLALFVGVILALPALGISMVKPCVVGTTARASKDNVRSIGYSIYYTMVNIGGAAGPYLASWAHRHLGVERVYRVAALSVFAMFFVVILFFREPRKAGDAPPPSIATVARNFCVVVGKAWLVLPVLAVALALRIGMFFYPDSTCPGGSGSGCSCSCSPASAGSCGSSCSLPATGSCSGSSTSVCRDTSTGISIRARTSKSFW